MGKGVDERAEGQDGLVGDGSDAHPEALDRRASDSAPALPIAPDDFDGLRVWTPPRHEWRVRLAVLGLAALIFLPNLGAFGLWDPWETHYGAVTTEMLETYDWVNPWWGYKEQIGTEPKQGNPFYSKPIFIFWSEAFMSRLMGRGEWALRLPMALLAMMSVFFIYLCVSKIWTRRAGLISAVVTATSPQFFMISRQAQTDMPFVATMTLALCFLMMGLFCPREKISRRGFWTWVLGSVGFLLICTIPQYFLLATDISQDMPDNLPWQHVVPWLFRHQGWTHGLLYGLGLAGILGSLGYALRQDLSTEGLTDRIKDRWLRRCYILIFYVFCAQSTYAKGLLGFMLPGAIIFTYLLLSHTWRVLLKVELIRGSLVFICVCFPWYIAMLTGHGMAYYQRFFIHDHFNRLGAGVHQIDSGTFEHFIKWLGIGMFPWVVFVPLALIWLLRQRPRDNNPTAQARLFLSIWFLVAFTLFTVSSTKFHHYIFPAMPALAILTALFIDSLLENHTWMPRLVGVLGIGFFLVIAWDLHEDPQHLRNLMTYKYDRPMPEHLPIDTDTPVAANSKTVWKDSVFWRHTSPTLQSILTTTAFQYERWIRTMALIGLVALALFVFASTRSAGLWGLALLACMMSLWSLNYYMPSLTPHWSQKYLFDSYYDTCTLEKTSPEASEAYRPLLADVGLEKIASYFTPTEKRVCQEDVISWLITWRGETYYSYNELQPIAKEQPQFMPYLEERNGGNKFYILMERGKMPSFKSKLLNYSNKLKRKGLKGWTSINSWDLKIECDESLYFQMVSATPLRGQDD